MWKGSLISPESIERFKALYVSAGMLARKIGTNPYKVIILLAEQGIVPEFGPTIDGCPQFVFKRIDIDTMKIDISRLWLTRRMRSSNSNQHIKFKPGEVAEILGIDIQKVWFLVKSGLLTPIMPRLHKSEEILFKGHSVLKYIELFEGRDDLVSGDAAAEMLGEEPRSMYKARVFSGSLKPYLLKKRIGKNYYKRLDVENLIIQKTKMVLPDAI